MLSKNKRLNKVVASFLSFAIMLSLTAIYLPITASAVGTIVDDTILKSGIYQIKNAQTGQYMTVSNGATTQGSRLTQNNNTYADYQQFLVTPIGNGEYTIRPLHASDLAVCTQSSGAGTAVTVSSFNSSDSTQIFTISKNGSNNYYAIKNKMSNFANALMILNGSSTAGENMYQYTYDSGKLWHHWYFEFVGPESGVYAFQKSGTTSYMTSYTKTGGTYISQNNTATSPTENDNLGGLFKIIYRPITQDYVIRSMSDNAVLIYANPSYGSPRTIKLPNVSDVNVSSTYTWKMTRASYDTCYIWYQASDSNIYYLNMPASGSLTFATNKSSATKWKFLEYTNTQVGISIDAKDSHIIDAGTSIDLSSFASASKYSYYSTTIGNNSPGSAVFSISDISGTSTSIATISSTGLLSSNSQKPGVVRVTVSFSKGLSFSTNIYIAPTSSEYFFLQNKQGDIGYIQPNNNKVSKEYFTYDDTQLWQWIPYSSGWYKIKNVATGQYLTSPSNGIVGSNVSLESSTTTYNTHLWRKVSAPSGSGGSKIQSKYMADNYSSLCLCINSITGVLEQGTYLNNSSYYDEFNVVTIGNDVVYNRTLTWPTSIDPSYMIANLAPYYSTYTMIQPDIYMDLPTAQEYLENAKIMVFNGHGSPSVITIHEYPSKYIRNTDIYNPTNTNDSLELSNTDIVFFAGCSTGGNPCNYCDGKGKHEGHFSDCPNNGSAYYNMPKSAQYAGAKVAIGWSVTIYDNHVNDWIDLFTYYMNSVNSDTNKLHTAYEAYVKTNREITSGNANKAVIYGTDLDFRLSD